MSPESVGNAILENKEALITLAEAAKVMPGGARDFSTVWRWCVRGWRGIRIETVNVGGRVFTSEAALARWVAACSEYREEKYAGQAPKVVRGRTPAQHRAAQLWAKAELAKFGMHYEVR